MHRTIFCSDILDNLCLLLLVPTTVSGFSFGPKSKKWNTFRIRDPHDIPSEFWDCRDMHTDVNLEQSKIAHLQAEVERCLRDCKGYTTKGKEKWVDILPVTVKRGLAFQFQDTLCALNLDRLQFAATFTR